jgi:hypothetical protein
MAQSITSNFTGEVWEGITMSLLQGIDIWDKNLASLIVEFNSSIYLPNLEVSGNIDQAFDPTGVESGTVGTLTYTEVELDTTDRTVKIGTILPNGWRGVWREFAPSPTEAFETMMLNSKIRDAFVMRVLQKTQEVNSYNLWQGDTVTTGAPYANYDGLIKKVVDTAGTVDATTTGAATFTSSNIAGYMATVYDTLVGKPALKSKAGVKFIMSHASKSLYQDAEIAVSGKGPLYSQLGDTGSMFKDVEVVASNGFPDNFILCTYTSTDPFASTLHVGMRNRNDIDSYQFGQVANGSLYWFLRLDYSIGTAITTPTDIIYFDAR